MEQEARRSGIAQLGALPWGTHFCHFFASREDLLEVLVPFFGAGLEGGEQCLWLVADPLDVDAARAALAAAVADLESYERTGALAIVPCSDWYWRDGRLVLGEVIVRWEARAAEAVSRGFAGLRANGCESWQEDWADFLVFEREVDAGIAGKRVIVACSYSLAKSDAGGLLDVVKTHQFAIAKRGGAWEVVEAQELGDLKAELERQVAERTAQLVETSARLLDSEARLRQVAEHIDSVFWLAEADGTVVYVNAAYERVYGRRRDELLREPWSWLQAVHPDDRERVRQAAMAPRWGERQDETYRVLLPDGSIRWVRDRSFPIDERGTGVTRIAGIATDVTAEQTAEAERAALLAAEQGAREAAEAALARLHAIQSITDSALSYLGLDELLRELLTRLREQLSADRVAVLLHDPAKNLFTVRSGAALDLDLSRHSKVPLTWPLASAVIAEGRAMTFEELPPQDDPSWGAPLDQRSLLPRSGMAAPLKLHGRAFGVVTVSSVRQRGFTDEDLDLLRVVADRVAPAIERARLVETVRAAREQQKVLSGRILTAQEEERRRIAGELHDELGQVLTAVKIQLDSLAGAAATQPPAKQLASAIESVDQAMSKVRDLALDLRPAVLDDLGLPAALRWYVDRVARLAALTPHLALDPVPRLGVEVETACFRVAQEALTNVARHARARECWLELRERDDVLELTVRDDGVGFDVAATRELGRAGRAMGLMGMEERVTMLGGELRVRSEEGHGTEVIARLPLPHRTTQAGHSDEGRREPVGRDAS